ncbi:MAG TPA: hypothetical protein VK534_00815 [Methylomirabilota bacterium]|nr:hypothetical protein [Methylomirabilota bacterium]
MRSEALKNLQEQIKQTIPGSPEESAVLQQTREIKQQDTEEFNRIHGNEEQPGILGEFESKRLTGVVRPAKAQNAAHIAVKIATGEFDAVKIPVEHRPDHMPIIVSHDQQPPAAA